MLIDLFKRIVEAEAELNQVRYLVRMDARDTFDLGHAEDVLCDAIEAFVTACKSDPDAARRAAAESVDEAFKVEVEDALEDELRPLHVLG